MTSRVTQCPKCQTSFRVTDAQLDIANGAVRCGSCLHIFNATEHWLGETATTNKPEPITATNTETQTPLSFDEPDLLAGDDEAIFDELFGDDDFDDATQTEASIEPTPDSKSADNDTTHHEAPISDDDLLIDDNSPLFEDEDDSSELHFRDTGQHSVVSDYPAADISIDSNSTNSDLELSDSFLNLDQWEGAPTSSAFQDQLEDEPDSEEAWAEQLLLEDEDEPSQPEPEFEEYDDLLSEFEQPPPSPDTALDPDLLDILSEPENQHYQTLAEEEFVLGDEPMIAGERIGDDKHQLLANIEPEPVEISAEQQASRWKMIGWGSAIIICLLLLPAQFMYFNFDTLARDPSFRPLITSGCQLFSCTVPELHDISRIKSSNLMVRSHPKVANALVVDAIVTNRAAFKQPFPILELRFSDINNEPVAGRYFSPDEYLSGELSGLTTMPSQQPVHIALEIVDPGQQAVNYQLLFHQQKPR